MTARRCLLLTIVVLGGGAVAGWLIFRPGKFDFDTLGGTILVYEIAPDPEWPDVDPELLAEVLQRRLDPDDRHAATVRSVGKNRVEIRIARADEAHEDTVAQIKNIVLRVGRLEFFILANSVDDKEAIAHAETMINGPDNPDMTKELKDLQERGLPPPGLRVPGAKDLQVFPIHLAHGEKSIVTYCWLELSHHERRTLNLDNAAEHEPSRNLTWLDAKKHRGRAATLQIWEGQADRRLYQGALFYSRKCENRNLTEEERLHKAVDYFVLARHPEFDAEKRRTPKIDGSFLTSAALVRSEHGSMVSFSMNAAGADLFQTLTRKNVKSGNDAVGEDLVRRHLAIVMDGLILSAPTINSEITGGKGMITGKFTEEEAQTLVNLLRGGALPANLKPLPVSESVVAPNAGR